LPEYSPEVDAETRRRILIAKAAYAYELLGEPIMTDAEFDALAKEIQPHMKTRRPDIDLFFQTEFSPSTGMWIYKHPELHKISALLVKYHAV
jgi:NAD-dependent DNA ligase